MQTSSRTANMGWKYRGSRSNKGRATGKKQRRRRTIVILLVARARRGKNYGKKRSRRVSRHDDVLPPTTMIINMLGSGRRCRWRLWQVGVALGRAQLPSRGIWRFGGYGSNVIVTGRMKDRPCMATKSVKSKQGNHARHVDPPLDPLPLFERWLVSLCSGLCGCSSAVITRWSGCLS